MLIAGRTIQGLGAGSMYVLLDIVCCDLVSPRERGKFLGLMFSFSGIAAALGPVVGGALAGSGNWRWIFYMNLPICGFALAVLVIFMRVNVGGMNESETFFAKILRLDLIGNFIFIPSIFAILYGLITGGVQYPWSSWRVIVPLVLGIIGWIGFHVQQTFTKNPSVRNRLFANRASAIVYVITFLVNLVLFAINYFLPVYFQARGYTILRSGINYLPTAIGSLVTAVGAGIVLSKTGSYRPLHYLAFAILAIGFGLFTLFDGDTPSAQWVIFQLIASVGAGASLSSLLPAILAPLPEADVASAAATFSFIKTFGFIWGITISSVIFNNTVNKELGRISSPDIRDRMRDGAAYAFASEARQLRAEPETKWDEEVLPVYSEGFKSIWWTMLALSLLGLVLVLGEKHYELQDQHETQYGIKEDEKDSEAELGESGPRETAAGSGEKNAA